MANSDTLSESFTAEVISLGRITIPKTIRDLLGVSDGDYVKVSIEKKLPRTEEPQSPIEEVIQVE